MDLNDLEARLDRMHHSVGHLQDLNIQPHVRTKTSVRRVEDKKETTYETDFRAEGPTDVHTIVLQAIGSIASLKDHLKRKIDAAGGDPQKVEDCINRSKPLSMALDLWNIDKHGEPLRHPPRSGFHPQLRDIDRTLRGGEGQSSIEVRPATGEVMNSENVEVAIVGQVCNEEGQEVMELGAFFDACLNDLDDFLDAHPELQDG